MLKRGFYFTFDLKSAYHHIEIFNEHREFLGFSWEINGEKSLFFFQSFTFYLFTKVLRETVKYFIAKCMRIITFVDDGIGAKFSLNRAIYVKQYFEKLGFTDDKCEWLPNQILVWFGLLWDIEKGNFLLQKTAGSSGFKLVWTIFIWRKWKKKFSLKKWQKQKAKLFQGRQLLVILSDWRQGICMIALWVEQVGTQR